MYYSLELQIYLANSESKPQAETPQNTKVSLLSFSDFHSFLNEIRRVTSNCFPSLYLENVRSFTTEHKSPCCSWKMLSGHCSRAFKKKKKKKNVAFFLLIKLYILQRLSINYSPNSFKWMLKERKNLVFKQKLYTSDFFFIIQGMKKMNVQRVFVCKIEHKKLK